MQELAGKEKRLTDSESFPMAVEAMLRFKKETIEMVGKDMPPMPLFVPKFMK